MNEVIQKKKNEVYKRRSYKDDQFGYKIAWHNQMFKYFSITLEAPDVI
jgi:hypothetical protein